MFDDSNEATVFDKMPLGAQQRVIPRRIFKAVPSKITELDDLILVPPPPPPPNIVRTNVRLIAELPMFPPPSVHVSRTTIVARALSRFALPIGGALVAVLLSLYLVLPAGQ